LEARTVPTVSLGFSSLEFFKRGAWDGLHETFQFSGTVNSMNNTVIDMSNTNPINVGDSVTVSYGATTQSSTVLAISPNVSITLNSSFPSGTAVTVKDVDFESAGQFPITLLDLSAPATASTTGTIANTDTNHPFAFGAPATAVITTANTSGFSAGQFVLVTQGSGSSSFSLYSFIDSVSTSSISLDDTWPGSTTLPVTVSALQPSSPEFFSLCWDLQNFLTDWLGPLGSGMDAPPPTNTNIYPVAPTLSPTLSSAQNTGGTTSAAQRISYLYNNFGTIDISSLTGINPGTGLQQGTSAQAVGLQVAIWELEYGNTFTGLTVDSQAGNTSGSVVAQEQMDVDTWTSYYVNLSLNNSYKATFLQANGTSTQVGGGDQGMLAVPMITTNQQPASATVGSSIADKATVLGGVNPTGTVTFNLYNNASASGTPLFTDTEPLVSGMAISAGYTATATGTDYWVATYNGDSNNTAVTSSPTAEPVTITPATPTINTSQQPPTAVVGSLIADKATVTGGFNPTGTVTFNLYNNPSASGTPLFTDTEPLSGGMATSKTYVTAAAGTDYWVATYNGDSNNNSVTSGTQDEPVVISPPSPPSLLVDKTADSPTITAGQTAGFVVTITNNSSVTDTNVTLSDPLPPGTGADINWQIDTSGTGHGAGTTPADFQITGAVGSQSLGLSSYFLTTLGDSLAPGQSISVHITGLTSANDGASASPPLVTAAGYAVLATSTGVDVSIPGTSGVAGNIGISHSGILEISGSAQVMGNVDFYDPVVPGTNYKPSGTASVTGTVQQNQMAVQAAINSALGESNAIATHSATTLTQTSGTITGSGGNNYFRYFGNFNLTGNLTLSGGPNDYFYIDITGSFNQGGGNSILLNGVDVNHVFFNIGSTANFGGGGVENGNFLATHGDMTVSAVTVNGRLIGGVSHINITSGAQVHMPTGASLVNTATVSASGVPPQSSMATITITPAADLQVTKTADQTSVTAGNPIGFTITITNPSGAAATGVTLTDHLPPGGGGDVFWTIDTSNTGLGAGTNPSAFTISGPKGSQVLTLSGQPITLAAGATLKVHITSPTNATDVSGGAVGMQSGVNPISYLGAGSDYGVLYILTGVHTLQITNVTIGANIGVGSSVGGSGMPKVSFGGPGVITGRLDFQGPNTGQFNNANAANVGPASVNYNVGAVTSAISTVTNLSASLAGLGNNIAINGNQTINESAGQLDTINGVTYRVFNVTSYSENDGKLVTINGDGSGDPVVFDFGFNSNVNLGGDVAITGNGLSDDKIIWNFTATGKSVSLNNNASSYFGVAFHGIILAPAEAVSLVNANLSGRVFGGYQNDMQIVSGVTLHAPVLNTATVTASNVTFDSDDTSSASITITGSFKPAKAQVAENSSATADSSELLGSFAELATGTLLVYVDTSAGNVTADELTRIDDAIASIDARFAEFGVNLVDVTSTDTTGGADAAIHITLADTTDLGGVPEGILGLEESGGAITIVSGWNWYTGADPALIGADQYDFQTTVTHELGHSLGLGHSTDPNSPMYWSLPTGVTRRSLTTSDLTVVEDLERDPLRVAPINSALMPGARENSSQAIGFALPPLPPVSAGLFAPFAVVFAPAQGLWYNGVLGTTANSLPVPQTSDPSRGPSLTSIDRAMLQDELDDDLLLILGHARTRVETPGTVSSMNQAADVIFSSLDCTLDNLSFMPDAPPASHASNDAGDVPGPSCEPCLEGGGDYEADEN
jgi:uncharacterized repeat protein (TIGR01451 family)